MQTQQSLMMANPAQNSSLTGSKIVDATPSLTMANPASSSSQSELVFYHQYSYFYYLEQLISYCYSYIQMMVANPAQIAYSYYYTSYLLQLVNYHYFFYCFYYKSMTTQISILSPMNPAQNPLNITMLERWLSLPGWHVLSLLLQWICILLSYIQYQLRRHSLWNVRYKSTSPESCSRPIES